MEDLFEDVWLTNIRWQVFDRFFRRLGLDGEEFWQPVSVGEVCHLAACCFFFSACGLCLSCRPSLTWGQQSQALRICGPWWIWLCYTSFHQLILLTNIWNHMNHMTWIRTYQAISFWLHYGHDSLRKWMDHFVPSSNIFMIAGHHAHRSPEYQGTSCQWKGTFAEKNTGILMFI